MEDAAANILAQAVESALKNVGERIKRQLIDPFNFTRNINGLEEEAEKLTGKIQGVKRRKTDEGTNNARKIDPEVDKWLERSEELIEEKRTILNQVPNATGGRLRFATRFSLSQRAIKTTEAMTQQLQENCNFVNDICLPRPTVATEEIQFGTTYAFGSRKKMEEEILTTLEGKKDSVIAIHGMGGVGKTTMAKRIMNALLNEHVFGEVVIAVVSQVVDKFKIQHEIGEQLGLKDLENYTTERARAKILHARLSAPTTRTLLVLDDVWEKLDLVDLGIPCSSEGCTILITSRNSDPLRAMDVKNVFEMKQLSDEEAWLLFRQIVGTCVDDEKLKSTAQDVMRECKGLPIALVTLGAALKDEKSNGVWRDTLGKLRNPNPISTPHYIAEVYNALRVSYDKLDEEFKTPFLLCCLFPEDANISVEELTYFCMGLQLFDDLGSLGEVRDRMSSLVKMLKSRSLLLDGDKENHVRLHDVVRDVCIFIAKQKRYIGGNDCAWISNSQRLDARTEVCTNLRLLISDYYDDEEFRIDSTFFEGMRELCVLSIASYSWTSLPDTIQSLNHLRTLILDECYNLETISVVCSLVRLEILICRYSISKLELPEEIKGLKHLKLLELTNCIEIDRGIISSLDELEELKMISFRGWDVPRLRELEVLKKLRCLEIRIADRALIREDINLSLKLERFDIRFDDPKEDYPEYPHRFDKIMVLWLDERGRIGHWIRKLLKDTECLDVYWNGAADIQNYCSNIKWLRMEGCGGIKSIATTSGVLEYLELNLLPQLEEIWSGPANSLTFLQNLQKIDLYDLPALKHLWKSNTNIVSLPQLEILDIYGCEMMEQLFVWSDEDENEITNRGSPNATQMDQGVVKFPLLQKMIIKRCPKMRSITRNNKIDTDDHSSHLFCQPQKELLEEIKGLKHLKLLELTNCSRLRSIGRGIISSLVELEELKMLYIFDGWEAADLRELEALKKLRCLEINIADRALLSEDINLSSKLERFDIRFDDLNQYYDYPYMYRFDKKLMLRLDEGCSLGDWIRKLLKDTKCLDVKGNGAADILNYCSNIQWLKMEGCEGIKSIATTSGVLLEYLHLSDLPQLEEIWSGPANSLTFLKNLQRIELHSLPALKNLWKSNTNMVSLPQLEILEIRHCKMMEQLFVWSEENENEITNRGSPNATQIQGVVKFPLLQKMKITDCPNMRSITGKADTVDHSLHLFCQPKKVSFGCLNKLEICFNPFCHHHHINVSSFNELEYLKIVHVGSLSLLTATVARNLVNLKELVIEYCDDMVVVMENEKDEGITVSGGERSTTLLFPKLRKLELKFLPKLEIFWESNVELPLLEEVNIEQCPNMMKFTLGSVATPCLKSVTKGRNDKYNVDGTTDLNGFLHQHFVKEKEITNEDDDESRDSEGDTSNGDGDVETEKGMNEASKGEDDQSISDDEKRD